MIINAYFILISCSICGSQHTSATCWIKNRWGEGHLCQNCYKRKRYHSEPNERKKILERNNICRMKNGYNERRVTIRFRGEQLYLKVPNPRIGVCSECGRKVGFDIKITNLHHVRYDNKDPLAHTIELCVRCHNKKREIYS